MILSNANWHCSFHMTGWFFLSSLRMGSQTAVNLAINLLMNYSFLRNSLVSFSVFGTEISLIALVLSGSTSIPFWMTMYPSILLEVTLNTHFLGLSLILYFLTPSEELFKSSWVPFSCFWFFHHVIYLHFHFFVYHVMEHSCHHSLIGCTCIF